MNPTPSDRSTPESNRVLRVLHLEDNPHDRELVKRVLASAQLECELTYATSRNEFETALRQDRFDAILSDFTLPGYGGNAALAFAQAQCPATPYIFVSGTIGEERAIESLKNGATDYVLKNRLERLVPALRRALREADERAQRRAAEAALRLSEERFREMAETIRDVFWISARHAQQWLYVSPAYAQIFGGPMPDPATGPALRIDAVPPEHRERVHTAWQSLDRGMEYRVDYPILRPDGSTRWVEDRGYPVFSPSGELLHAVGVVTDITDRKQLEAQLLQAQKMEAIGQLAGGIAHDFNNILTVINGSACRLLDGGHLAPADVTALKQIYTAGERAASLTRQLLVFSRKQAMRRQPLELNAIIEDAAALLGRLIGEDIHLELHLATGLPAISADGIMMEQVLMNLAVNARDAMPRGGRLTLTTQTITFDATDTARHASRRPGEFVRLSVQDSGCGIAAEVLPRIFEPFFTTKGVGAGTGLGLATVFGIVDYHDGWLEVESTVGQGTRFDVFLPPTSEPVRKVAKSSHPFSAPAGHATILLVEDEGTVREFAVAVLEHAGYRVLQATSGVQALEVWKWHQSRIALLLTDLVMPDGLTGVDLAKTLQAEKPSLKIVFTSGYTREMTGDVFALRSDIPFLQKPYVPATLLRLIGEVLGAAP